jgi:hypothetical protein
MSEQKVRKVLPESGDQWRHFKGGLYDIVCVARLEEDLTPVVVYEPITDSNLNRLG